MSEFRYACGYYPKMQKKEDWRKDLETMRQCHIRYVRTAELFNSWDQIEPEEDKFDFEFLDEFFDLCEEYGLGIILGTGTASPPYWLHEKYPEVNILNNHGAQYPNNVSYTWACIDNPDFRRCSEKYIRVLSERYKDHPALFCYQIHNEISFPFMPLQGSEPDLYCYCEHSQNKFRTWLKKKYKTIEALNYAYRWGATNTVYSNFDQVEAPKTKCTGWASVTRWLDWRLFWMENLVDFVKWQNDLIKEMDSTHPTSTNIFFLKGQDPLGVITALDQFRMAEVVDFIGYDLYPGSGNKLEKKPEFSSMFLDLCKSTVHPLEKDYWLMETESGPINGWVLGPSRNVNGNDLKRNVFEAIGHESRMTLYQVFRECDFQPIHWGGIVDLDGEHTKLTKAAKEIGEICSKYKEFFGRAKNPQARAAILYSKETAILLSGMNQDQVYLEALRGMYRMFWERNYPVDFVTPEELRSGYADRYSMIMLPFTVDVNNALEDSIAQYVANGGIAVATSRLGFLGEHGWYNHSIPCGKLKDVFGVVAEEVDAGIDPAVSFGRKTYTGYWYHEHMHVNEEVEILAEFVNDTPAITMNSYGKGKAVYIATLADAGYMKDGRELLWDLMEYLFAKYSFLSPIEVFYTGRKDREIGVNLLKDGDEGMLVVTQYIRDENSGFMASGKKHVHVMLEGEYYDACDVLGRDTIKCYYNAGDTTLEFDVRKDEVKLISIREKRTV